MLLHYRGAVWDSATLVSRHPPAALVEVFCSTHCTYRKPHSDCAPLHDERQTLKWYQMSSNPAPGSV